MINKLLQWRLKLWSSRLGWKLMTSYLIVILVGVLTLAMAAESVVPGTFNRHVTEMAQMMGGGINGSDLVQMESDLFSNYRAAFTEALTLAAIAAFISAGVVSFLVSQRVIIPVQRLMTASRRIAAGRYDDRVPAAGDDELAELARSFNQMAEALSRTETMRRDLIGNVTHELRTPLTSIKGYMEGVMDGVLPAEPDTFQQVYREADRLQRLVNDLQELSRVEAHAVELHRVQPAADRGIRHCPHRLPPHAT